jgi:hypothetical protein
MRALFARILITLFYGAISCAALAQQPEYNGDIDYMKKTGRLWGIAELRVNTDDSVSLVDANYSEDAERQIPGYGLFFWQMAEGNLVTPGDDHNQITLRKDQACMLSDGHHAFITYTLTGIEEGTAIIRVKEKFDARSFGDGVMETTETFRIKPYKIHE